jgi:hypothetical protein
VGWSPAQVTSIFGAIAHALMLRKKLKVLPLIFEMLFYTQMML